MKHSYKTTLFKCLDVLPEKLGFYLYHQIQNLFAKENLDYKINSTKSSFDTICNMLSKSNFEIKDKNIVELGSGWVPILPYLLVFEAKAKSVATYDINQHYKKQDILKLNDYFRVKYNSEIQVVGKYCLPESITYFPKTDICIGALDNVDVVVSRFVLEHVPPQIIKNIHQQLAEKLPSGSLILHLISPSDHRAYTDKSLSLFDFLKYSQLEWNKIQTKFDYHNRLRLPHYIDIFKNTFDIISVTHASCKSDTEQYQKFKKLKINKDFQKYSDEELTAGAINILLRVK